MPIGKPHIGTAGATLTPEGGVAVKVLNKTGAPSIKGYIVEPSLTTDNAVKYTDPGDSDPLGVVYESGVPDGNYMWIIVSGIADVYYRDTVTRATFSRVATAVESGTGGQAVNEALPTPPFSTDKHFQEIGHPIESRIGAGLAKTVIHFN